MIIYSAIKNLKTNKIYLAINHGEIFQKFPIIKKNNNDLIMGFLTDKLIFLDRKNASDYVIKNKQIQKENIIKLIKGKELFSEDILLEQYDLFLWSEYNKLYK
jgi:hypothetical protein